MLQEIPKRTERDEVLAVAHDLTQLSYTLTHGCGNHGCRIKPPTGQGTNAICQCSPRKLSARLRYLVEEVEQWKL